MNESNCHEDTTGFRKPTRREISALTRLLLPVGYQWPASGLIGYDMAKLQELKKRTGKPVSQLLHEAVHLLYDTMTEDVSATTTIAEPTEKRSKTVEPLKPVVEAYVSGAKRNVQRTLFSDSAADTAICAETDVSTG